jgi:release factor glutamine methyltransferase
MLTVLEAIKLATEYFEKKEIESPRINAEILLSDVLKCKRLDLYLKFDQPLKEVEVDFYREYISRRGKYEPVQYIVGNTEFYGLIFKVDKSVLIPRPETEILVETIINQNKEKDGLNILDIGTGSGNIPVSLAKMLPQCKITSIDISESAIEIAKQNAVSNNVNGNITFIKQDVFNDPLHFDSKFNIIVSNPPYVDLNEYNNLQKEIVAHEPRIAVTDDGDGLKYYRRISEVGKNILLTNGIIYFEMGKGQATDIRLIMEENGFSEIGIVKDYQQIDRVIYGTKK